MTATKFEQTPEEPYNIGSSDSLPPVLSLAESAGVQTDSPIAQLGGAALAGSFWYYRNTLRDNARELDFDTQDALVADVAAGLAAEEAGDTQSPEAARGRDARVRLVNSFAERVVNIAQWKCNRVGRWDVSFREETMQAGMLTTCANWQRAILVFLAMQTKKPENQTWCTQNRSRQRILKWKY